MNNLIHLAMNKHGVIVAHFAEFEDAAEFCRVSDMTHVPFNKANRDGAAPPPVGTKYNAWANWSNDEEQCITLGFWAKFVSGQGWVTCDPEHTGARPDVNRLIAYKAGVGA
jgi:hypothetical protein